MIEKKKENRQIHDWLMERPSLSLTTLERESDIARGTLQHFVQGRRGLSTSTLLKLIPVLEKYGYENKL